MPTYKNRTNKTIYIGNNTFLPYQKVETMRILDVRGELLCLLPDSYNINITNNTFIIRFNSDENWSNITLTSGNKALLTHDSSNGNGDVIYTAVNAGENSNSIQVAHIDPGSADQSLSIDVSENDITINLATDSESAVTSTALDVETVVNADPNASALVVAVKEGDGSGVVLTVSLINLVGGTNRTASQIAEDINTTYGSTVAENKNDYINLLAPTDDLNLSTVYVKNTGNTANSIFGFMGKDNNPINSAVFPQLLKISELPYFNPLINIRIITFSAAGTKTININFKEAIRIRIFDITGGPYNVYINDTSKIINIPSIKLSNGDSTLIDVSYSIQTLTIDADNSGSLTIEEYRSL